MVLDRTSWTVAVSSGGEVGVVGRMEAVSGGGAVGVVVEAALIQEDEDGRSTR